MNKKKLFYRFLLIFIFINIFIAILWPIRTYLKFKFYKPYSKEYIQSLEMKTDEVKKLYLETWQRERLLVYDEYTGFKESSFNGKYVNIDNEIGRKVPGQNKKCLNSIYFYGSEDIFGYDVSDQQTIPAYFYKFLNDLNYCVYNFGRKSYNSTQINILFQKHLLNNKLKKNDILVFLDGDNENGNEELLNTKFIIENYNKLHKKFWNLYITGFEYFFNLLPITQFAEQILKRFKNKKYKRIILNDELKIQDIFLKNIKIRNLLCKEYKLQCYNFIFFKNFHSNKKYNFMKNGNSIINLNDDILPEEILVNRYNSLYPNTNKKIAIKMYNKIFKN